MADPGPARDDLRDAVLRMRRPLDPRILQAASDRAVQSLAGLTAVRRARVVALPAAAEGDLDPQGLVGVLAGRGIQVLRVEPAGDEVRVVTTGRAHLVRPDEATGALVDVEVVVVPGVAFDLDGGRLGPHDDPWEDVLAHLDPEVLRIGLAHTTQLVPRVPRGDDDRLLDVVVTDRGVHHTGARARPRDA